MELFFRAAFHNFQKFLFNFTGLSNPNAYINNIKKIESLVKNDYRDFIGEEVSSESEGSCSVVSGDESSSEEYERTDDFEYPSRIEEEGRDGSSDDTEAESNESKNTEQ